MSDTLDILRQIALQVRNASAPAENTAERVGRVLVGILENLSQTASGLNIESIWEALYNSTNEQINISHLTSALSGYATETFVFQKITDLIASSPDALDTLNELAAALGNDPNFATTVLNSLATKVDKLPGYRLSQEDFTTILKNKLNGIEDGANKYILTKSDILSVLRDTDGVIRLDAHIALTGGLINFADLGTINIPSIYANLPVDGTTIGRDASGALTVLGGVGLDTAEMWAALSAPTNEQIAGSHLSNALAGYALKSEIPSLAGYALKSEIPSLAGYATESYVTARFAEFIGSAPEALDTVYELAAALQGNTGSINDIMTSLGTKWTQDNTKIAAWDNAVTLAHTHANKTVIDGITSALISNWNTAAGWGNHASAGYMHLAGTETVSGEKNFTGGLKVNGQPIVYNAAGGYWQLNGSLVLSGGLVTFANLGDVNIPSIYANLPIDGVSIKRDANGTLYAVGGAGGVGTVTAISVNGSTYNPVNGIVSLPNYALAGHVHNFADINNKPSTLGGYGITDAYTTSSADNTFLKLAGGTMTGQLSFSGTQRNISGLNRFYVTDWTDFQLSAGAMFQILDSSTGKYLFKVTAGSTTVEMPDATALKISNNTVWHSGNFTNLNQLITRNFSDLQNKPTTLSGYGITDALLASAYTAADVLTKIKTVDGAGSGLDADLVRGYAVSVGSDTPFNTIPVIHPGGWMDIGVHLEFHYDNVTASDYSTILRCSGNYSNIVWLPTASGTLALLSDNVESANRLKTTRTIWGQNFDGTGNISGALENATTGSFSSHIKIGGGTVNLGGLWDGGLIVGNDGHDKVVASYLTSVTNAATIGAHNSALDNWAKLNIAGTSIQFSIGEKPKMNLDNGGNLGIGTESPAYKLDVNGTLRATDAATASRFYTGYDSGAANSISCSNWFRSNGNSGWYNATYDGGITMTDSDQVRVYNNKVFYNDGVRVWGINGHNVGLKLYSADHVGINLANSSYTWGIYSNGNGNLYIGRRTGNVNDSSGSYRLTIGYDQLSYEGSIILYGGGLVTFQSDMRLKTNIHGFDATLNQLAALPIFTHEWRDGTPGVYMSTSAQAVRDLMPCNVQQGKDGYLVMDGTRTALAVAIRLAQIYAAEQAKLKRWQDAKDKQIEQLQETVRELSNRVYNLEHK